MGKILKKPTGKHWILNTLMTVLLFAFLFSASVFIVLAFRPFYYLMIHLFRIPEDPEMTGIIRQYGITADVCKRNYDALIQYNLLFGTKVLNFPDFPMSVAGRIHFEEVRNIFIALQYIMIGSGLALIPVTILAKKKHAYGWGRALLILTLSVLGIAGLALAINSEWTFEFMHKVLFRNDYWMFYPDEDPIIAILPFKVFLTDGILILVFMAGGLVLSTLLARKIRASNMTAKRAKKTKKG